MSESVESAFLGVQAEEFLNYMKGLPFCHQENGSLVAVHKLTSEVIEAIREHEVKLFPGGIAVKLPRSILMGLQKHYDDGQPLPAVLVWKAECVEIWFRRQKSTDFPYDTWTDPSALLMERERVIIPKEMFPADFTASYQHALQQSKQCPAMIPDY
jgi:hypothetical protein